MAEKINPELRAKMEAIARRPRREPDNLTESEARVMAMVGMHRARKARAENVEQ